MLEPLKGRPFTTKLPRPKLPMKTVFVKGPLTKEDVLNWLAAKFFKLPLTRQKDLFPLLRTDLKIFLIKERNFKP
jgi:hypothetical protein